MLEGLSPVLSARRPLCVCDVPVQEPADGDDESRDEATPRTSNEFVNAVEPGDSRGECHG